MDLAARISAARREKGLSVRGLAAASGLSPSTVQRIEGGEVSPTMETLDRMLPPLGLVIGVTMQRPSQALQRQADQVRGILAHAGISEVRVCGSVARRQDTPDSDVDLLVHVPDGFGLLEAIAVEEELSELLGFPVDLVSDAGEAEVLSRARAEAVPL